MTNATPITTEPSGEIRKRVEATWPSIRQLVEQWESGQAQKVLAVSLESIHSDDKPDSLVERLNAWMEMFVDRVQQQSRAWDSRHKAFTWKLTRLSEAASDRAAQDAMDQFRQVQDDGWESFEVELSERARERSLPNALSINRITNLLEDLSVADFTEEPAGKVLRLKVGQDFVQQALRVVQQTIQDEVRADIDWLKERVSALQVKLSAAFPAQKLGLTSAQFLDDASAWNMLREMIQLDSRYHGELPRRTLFDRLSQGRRPVFGIMMVVSLVGAAFGMRSGLAAGLAPAMLVLFVGGVCWTYFSFREEREQILERELLRVRESLSQEVKRLYESVSKQWLALLLKSLRDLRKQGTRDLDQSFRAQRIDQAKSSEVARKEIQEKLKVIDQRQREIQGVLQQTQRLRQSISETASQAKAARRMKPEETRATATSSRNV